MGWTILDPNKLRVIDLFANLSDKGLEDVAAIIYTKAYKRGKKIFSEGDPGRAMYVIQRGEVRISKTIPGIGEEALAILPEGAYFGEMALLVDEPRSADAWASKACVLSVIDKEDLRAMMRNNHDLSTELLWCFVETLCRRLREANSKVTFLAAAGRF